MCASSKAAALLLGELIELGVRDFVVCPGSRSQALALVAAEAEKLGLARLHVRVDERSAAFFALGIARETGLPSPVIVTSGTAVANLLPAVLEAHSARVPMLLLTADRPKSMRGVRSNQTISEPVALKAFTRYFSDIEATQIDQKLVSVAFKSATGASTSRVEGVSQLNIAFVEPLSGASGVLQEYLSNKIKSNNIEQGPLKHSAVTPTPTPTQLADDRPFEKVYAHRSDDDFARAVVIAGADSGPAAENFAHLTNLPLLAEPSSGARFGREAIQHWVRLLKDEELQSKIQRVIVFGHPTLTRIVPQLIQNKNTVVIDSVITDEPTKKSATGQVAETYNPAHAVDFFATSADVSNEYDRELLKPWLGEWVVRDRALRAELTTVHQPDLEAARATGYKERSSYARSEVARLRKPVTREHLTETLWLTTWPHDRLVVASSRLVRVLNETAAPRNIKVHANRGLAGIDGTIATARGIATASQTHDDPRLAAGTTRVLIGDLALFHDAGSLALTPGEFKPRIQLVVGNDSGGTIFDTLEVFETAEPEVYDRVMRTPQQINIKSLAEAYGWGYRLVVNEGELERLFTEPVTGPEIVEVEISE